jgi:23S rRNA (cytosine1962-C5)-methyltransferase
MTNDSSFFNKLPERPIKLTIRPDRIRDLKRGHPWVYGNSLTTLPEAKPGSFAIVRDSAGKILAKGMYDPSCPIAFRVCALEEELNDALIARRIEVAIHKRTAILNQQTSGCRLIYGEGDYLPGLICDQFSQTGVIQTDGDGPAQFWQLESIAKLIAKTAGLKSVYLKPRSGSQTLGRALVGSVPTEPVHFNEHGALFETDVVNGQKTGFFLDQRENRLLIKSLAKDRNVLNLFAYTGGFSVAAGLGGATSVVSVDIAKPAIATAERNWQLNQLASEQHQGVATNVFDYLSSALDNKKLFELIIVDPPSFVTSKAALEKGRGAYVSIFSQSASLVSQGGLLALSSCSSQVSAEVFLEICSDVISKARRRATVLHISGQPSDHPFPLACEELRYLKFILFELD